MESPQEIKTLTFRMWHQELENILIEQGLQGYTERAILKYFKDRDIDPDEIKAYLELLLKEDAVQKFKYKRDFYWRATVELPRLRLRIEKKEEGRV